MKRMNLPSYGALCFVSSARNPKKTAKTTGSVAQDSSESKDTARKVAGGAALGALIGAIADGGEGAAIGAGAGTAASAASEGQQVVIGAETLIQFRLEEALTVPIAVTVKTAEGGCLKRSY